jgi:acetyl-CoA acetyltransferase
MREVAIIGVGMHPWGKFPEKNVVDLAAQATRQALQDAGVEWKSIQAVVAGVYKWGAESGMVLGQSLAGRLGETGVPITNIYNMCATATSVFRSAYLNVASGECDLALAVAADISPLGFLPTRGNDTKDPAYIRFSKIGLTNPAYWAMDCRKRMDAYGTTETHLAKAKVAASKNGAKNPSARYRKEYTVEEVLNSPIVSHPLRLFEICATSDGAAAAVICSLDKAKQFTNHPVIVAGVGLGSARYGDPSARLGMVCFPAEAEAPILSESVAASRMAYEQAGVGPENIDFVELPDNSSWHYLQYLESLGFCKPGEADRLLDEGETAIDGKLPVCPSGGVSSFGEAVAAQGLAQICEIVWQLRGQSGVRQIPGGVKVGMAQTYGMLGNSGTAILKI